MLNIYICIGYILHLSLFEDQSLGIITGLVPKRNIGMLHDIFIHELGICCAVRISAGAGAGAVNVGPRHF